MDSPKLVPEGISWEFLPEHPLVQVYSYLAPRDRLQAGLTCTAWSRCLKHPLLWKRFVCRFTQPGHEKLVKAIAQDGHRIHSLVVEVDQHEPGNRARVCQVLHSLAENEQRRLTSFTLRFVGDNPMLYAGADVITELKILFGCPEGKTEPFSFLTYVDLSGMKVVLDSALIDVLSENHPQLEFLNIQNRNLLCKVHPDSIVRLAKNCQKLKELRVINVSVNDDVLLAFAALDELSLEHLSMAFRRETKFSLEQSSEAWSMLVKKSPKLRVTLAFDHNCPLDRICEMMQPEMPVRVLRLETYTSLGDQLNMAASFYYKTLEKVVIQSLHNSEELALALIRLAEKCKRLRILLVYCVVDKQAVERILELLPEMKSRGSYILKWEKDDWPWKARGDVEEDDFNDVDPLEVDHVNVYGP